MENNNKVLFIASIAKHIIRFHQPYLQWFKEQGYETHVACSGDEEISYCDKQWKVPFVRTPYSLKHIKAYKVLDELIKEEKFKIIHCHTPMASVLTRLITKKYNRISSVIYTAHGFHFFKGGPFFNWLTYFPVEIWLSRYTDAIVTINSEDYQVIKKYGSKNASYYQIPGIGVNGSKFHAVSNEEKISIRKKNGFDSSDVLAVYAAEFIERKNHKFLIENFHHLFRNIPKIKILLAGRGRLESDIRKLIKRNNLGEKIILLGFRNDIDKMYKMSDIGISVSKQEGLGLNLVELMMCGLPVVATLDRGHKEIVVNGKNGYLFKQGDSVGFSDSIKKIVNNPKLYLKMSEYALKTSRNFELKNSILKMEEIYNRYLLK